MSKDLRAEHRAPDGGPSTPAWVSQRMKGVRRNKLTAMTLKDGGARVMVNKNDPEFDPSLYEEVPAGAPSASRVRIEPTPSSEVSDFPADQLAMMSMAELRSLPEWARVQDKSKIKSKQDAVDAIIAARAGAASGE